MLLLPAPELDMAMAHGTPMQY
eukprot:SAG31_NODE_37419_length_304_cov_1.000000_1_plen_21_part_10